MINLLDAKPGDRVYLIDGRTAVVVENMGDGQWLEVRAADTAQDAETELVHSQDVAELVPVAATDGGGER